MLPSGLGPERERHKERYEEYGIQKNYVPFMRDHRAAYQASEMAIEMRVDLFGKNEH